MLSSCSRDPLPWAGFGDSTGRLRVACDSTQSSCSASGCGGWLVHSLHPGPPLGRVEAPQGRRWSPRFTAWEALPTAVSRLGSWSDGAPCITSSSRSIQPRCPGAARPAWCGPYRRTPRKGGGSSEREPRPRCRSLCGSPREPHREPPHTTSSGRRRTSTNQRSPAAQHFGGLRQALPEPTLTCALKRS